MSPESQNSKPPVLVFAVAISFIALAEFGHLVSLPGHFATFWPNAGLMLALVLHQPVNRWGWVLLGGLVGNLISDVCFHDKSVLVATLFWLANSAETVAAAVLFRRVSGSTYALTNVRRVVQFVFGPCILGSAVGATLGSVVVTVGFGESYLTTWKIWWSGDFIGMLVVFPLAESVLSAWGNGVDLSPRRTGKVAWRTDAVLLFGLLILHGLITAYIFGYQTERLAYAVYPTLLWIVIRFGLAGGHVAILIMAIIMVAFTANGQGLFGAIENLSTRAIVIQVFLFVTSATFLILAASLHERQLAVSDLIKTKQELEAYVELIGKTDGSWSWNIPLGRVKFSARFREMLGYQPDDVEGFPNHVDSFSESLHPEDREQLWEHIQKHFDDGGVFEDEYRLRKKDGNYRWFRVRGNTTRSDIGEPLVMAGSTFDITDRKEFELQLNHSNTDLAQFAYVASHDLQEPLRAVAGFCQLLGRRYGDVLDEKAHGYIESAVDGASRMSVMIQDLLAFSRVGSDDQPLERVDLNEVVFEAQKSMGVMIAECNARIECSGDLPVVSGYRQMLIQLFQNLLSNAMKFGKPGVPVFVSVTAHTTDDHIQVCVEDNGVGIEPAYQAQIFTMFQRLHRREEVSGTGIGLAICQRVVDRHGGKIRVESNGSDGSRFILNFPLRDMQDA